MALVPVLPVLSARATVPALLALALLLLIGRIAAKKRLPFAPWAKTIPIFAFFAWAAVSLAWTLDPRDAFGTWAGALGLAVVGLFTLAALSDLSDARRRALARAFVWGFAVAVALLAFERLTGGAIGAVLRDWTHRQRMELSLLKPTATALALFLWPAAHLVFAWKGRLAAGMLIVVSLLVIGSVGGTGVAIALAVALAAFVAALLGARRLGALFSAAVVVVALAAPLLPRLLPDPAAIMQAYPSAPFNQFHRLYIWKYAGAWALEKPLLGWGMGSSRHLQKHKMDTGAFVPERYGSRNYSLFPGQKRWEFWLGFYRAHPLPLHPHDAALQIWLELGAVGIVLAAWAFWKGTGGLRRAPPDRLAFALPVLVTGTITALLNFGLWQSWWLAALWLAAGLAAFAGTAAAREP
jgi:O-antigen ligase